MASGKAAGYFALCVAANSAALWLLAVPFADIWFSTDEGLYAYQAQRILDGQVIYRDFFQAIMPGYFFMLAGWMKVAGMGVASLRAFMILLMLATSIAIYLASRRLGVPTLLSIVPALTFSVLRSRYNFELNHYAPNLLFETATLSLVCSQALRPARWKLALAGTLVSADVLTTQHVGAHLLIGTIFSVVFLSVVTRQNAWREMLSFIEGALPLPIAYLGYAVHTGSLAAMFRCTVLWVFSHYTRFDTQDYWYYWVRLTWRLFTENPGAGTAHDFALGVVESFAAPAAVLISAVWLLRLWRVSGTLDDSQRAFGAAALIAASMYACIYAAPNSIISRVSLTGYLLAYALVHRVYSQWRRPCPRLGLRGGLVPGGVAALLLLAVPLRTARVFGNILLQHSTMQTTTYRTAHGPIRLPVESDTGQLDVLSFLARNATPAEFVYAANWSPWVYYLGGYRNPGTTEYLLPYFTTDATVRETVRILDSTRTRWLVQDSIVRRGLEHNDGRLQSLSELLMQQWQFNRYRDSSYTVAVVFGDYTIYRRKETAPE
ncbi:MAG: hypothetical protein AB1714_16545 [Acidobacteriota bacterium]